MVIFEKKNISIQDMENLRRRLILFLDQYNNLDGMNSVQTQDFYRFTTYLIATNQADSVTAHCYVNYHDFQNSIFLCAMLDKRIQSQRQFEIHFGRKISIEVAEELQALLNKPSREQLLEKIQADSHALELKNKRISELNNKLENSMYNALIAVAALRDNETGDHLLRTSKLGRQLAEAATDKITSRGNITSPEVVERAIPLHDIGKVGIPDSILLKPGKLTLSEFDVMKGHAAIGANLIHEFMMANDLMENEVLNTAYDIAKYHHENFDGTGYPEGLKSTSIPWTARIMTIVDVYDALISERPYKIPLSKDDALKEMISISDWKFDPTLFKMFLHII